MIIRDNFYYFCIKNICCDSHLNRLDETVQMSGHNIWFLMRNKKIIIKYSLFNTCI